MLKVENLSTGYGSSLVVEDVNLEVGDGKIVALIGPNGAGKTTTLRAVAGVLPVKKGTITLGGRVINGLKAHKVVRLGLALVPSGRMILDRLSVRENLSLGGYSVSAQKRAELMERVLGLFPVLRERANQPGGTLSGGEQQMLAIARGMMADPKMLVLDEPSMGLSPKLVSEVFAFIRKLNKEMGLTVLVAEQNAYQALSIADWAYVLESGNVVMQGEASKLEDNPDVQSKYLGKAGR